MSPARKPRKIPVTVITGYLGSGKTTLVNALLSRMNGARVAVVVNEFGAVGIDGALITDGAARAAAGSAAAVGRSAAPVIELANGCLCCVLTGEFRQALEQLPLAELDHVLIETSGAADPTSIVKTIWGAPELSARYRLDGVVCVADGERFRVTSGVDAVASLQVSIADVVLVSKADRVSTNELAAVRRELVRLNPWAELGAAHAFELHDLLGLDAYRRPRFTPVAPKSPDSPARATASVLHAGLVSAATSWEGSLSRASVQAFFRALVLELGERLVRCKALLHLEGEKAPWLVQGVQSWIERSSGPASYRGPNRLFVLARDVDGAVLEKALARLRAGSNDRLRASANDRLREHSGA